MVKHKFKYKTSLNSFRTGEENVHEQLTFYTVKDNLSLHFQLRILDSYLKQLLQLRHAIKLFIIKFYHCNF